MKRRSNWPAMLTLFIEEKRNQPFSWAENNCCFFAADWIAMLTGTDPALDFRGKITSATAAAREFGTHGSVVGLADEILGAIGVLRIPVLTAQRGDICAHETEHGPALGVCMGSSVAFAGKDGVETVPLAGCLAAWRI